MTPSLFPDLFPAPPDEPARDATDSRFPGATATQRRAIAKGLHPMGHPMPGPDGSTCGTCGHHYRAVMRSGKAFHKCDLVRPTGGPATDTRAGWPACSRWEEVPDARP